MSNETKIIMPTKTIDKDKLTEEEKTALLSDAFRMEQDHATLEPASNVVAVLDEEDRAKLESPNPVLTSVPLVRGKMRGEAQGMTPRLPLAAHATTIGEDASLDDVPPMKRAQVLAERAKTGGK